MRPREHKQAEVSDVERLCLLLWAKITISHHIVLSHAGGDISLSERLEWGKKMNDARLN